MRSDTARIGRLEWTGLLLALAAIGLLLCCTYKLVIFSDPAAWFAFGASFRESFATRPLAFGFPLVVAAAIELVGPINALLVNVPLLGLLAAVFYAFARAHTPRDAAEAELAPFGAAVALLLFVSANAQLLSELSSPYRDPLAHLLLLLACLAALRSRRGGGALGWAAAAGLALGLACCTRETSVLMLAPLLIWSVAAKREEPTLRLLRSTAVFAAAFSLAAVPLLVQNYLHSGHPWLPAQAQASPGGELAPGIRIANLPDTLPAELEALAGHYGLVGLLLLAAGLTAGLRDRQPQILQLSLPALVLYALFYGCYVRVVPRYLFILDLFALPIAGAGAAALLQMLLARTRESVRSRLAGIAAAAAFIAVAGWALTGALRSEPGLKLAEARALRDDLASIVPPDARILGASNFARIARTLLPNPVRRFSTSSADSRLQHRPLREEAIAWALRGPDAYLLTLSQQASFLPSSLYRRMAASEVDLEPVGVLSTDRYQLLGFRGRYVTVDRLRPWSRLRSRTHVRAERAGRHVLELDVGRLSKFPRHFAQVQFGDQILDVHPADHINYYAVETPRSGRDVPVRLRSDAPVPSRLIATLRPLEEPIVMDFSASELPLYLDKLSDAFRYYRAARVPVITDAGSIWIPTLLPAPGGFQIRTRLILLNTRSDDRCKVEFLANGRLLHSAPVEPAGGSGDRAGTREVAFWVPPDVIENDATRLDLRLVGSARGGVALGIAALGIQRMASPTAGR